MIAAFSGYFARVQSVQGAGYSFDARAEVTVDDFANSLSFIISMEEARPFANGDYEALLLTRP